MTQEIDCSLFDNSNVIHNNTEVKDESQITPKTSGVLGNILGEKHCNGSPCVISYKTTGKPEEQLDFEMLGIPAELASEYEVSNSRDENNENEVQPNGKYDVRMSVGSSVPYAASQDGGAKPKKSTKRKESENENEKPKSKF